MLNEDRNTCNTFRPQGCTEWWVGITEKNTGYRLGVILNTGLFLSYNTNIVGLVAVLIEQLINHHKFTPRCQIFSQEKLQFILLQALLPLKLKHTRKLCRNAKATVNILNIGHTVMLTHAQLCTNLLLFKLSVSSLFFFSFLLLSFENVIAAIYKPFRTI